MEKLMQPLACRFALLTAVAVLAVSPMMSGCHAKAVPHVPRPDDFVLDQREPDREENEVCGPIGDTVSRHDEAFGRLIENRSALVVFKEEEGTSADRMMTPRLAECIERLAGRVADEWPGAQLRVTEAWDEDMEHREGSLHYEGRAADLTTTDRDKRKYGRLARMAVESGFDFVWYEDELHVHASVRGED
jgi:hypothetical protein